MDDFVQDEVESDSTFNAEPVDSGNETSVELSIDSENDSAGTSVCREVDADFKMNRLVVIVHWTEKHECWNNFWSK